MPSTIEPSSGSYESYIVLQWTYVLYSGREHCTDVGEGDRNLYAPVLTGPSNLYQTCLRTTLVPHDDDVVVGPARVVEVFCNQGVSLHDALSPVQ